MKKGVIVASFGTTHEDTEKKTIDVIENDIKENFKDYIFLRAWMSDIIRDKLKRRKNLHINSIDEAIQEAIDKGIEELLVVSTHIIDGVEHNKLKDTVSQYTNKFKSVKLSGALLETDGDFEYLIKEMDNLLKRNSDGAYLLMGHGSKHSSNKIYEVLGNKFAEHGRDDIYITCVEGYPYIEDVLSQLETYKNIHLLPFMIVAGDHAKNDMAGDGESFKTILEAENKIVSYKLKGLGEYDFVRKLILKHSYEAVQYVL